MKRIKRDSVKKRFVPPTPDARKADSNVYWKWNDGIDYEGIAKAALKRMNGGDEDSQPYYIVYHVDSNVGFANQFRSLCGLFLIALVSGRKFRSRNVRNV